jgi:autotransporter-associated beta strand protein
VLSSLALAVVALGSTATGTQAAVPETITATGCSSWTPPVGVTRIHISATGNAGTAGSGTWGGAPGGQGDLVRGDYDIGINSLWVCVNQGGGAGGAKLLTFGGPGGAGGGASGVALGADFASPLLIAGGGGGGGVNNGGSFGGGSGGSAGLPNAGSGATYFFNVGGGGGTQSAGGAGGSSAQGSAGATGLAHSAGGPGGGGAGGDGNGSETTSMGGGGGGGGYFGGGGGGGGGSGGGQASAGGGGGSDFCHADVDNCAVTSGAGSTTTSAEVEIRYSSSTTLTVRNAASDSGWAGTEGPGSAAYGDASVAGVSGTTPTGNVTYELFSNSACSGSASTSESVSLSGGTPPDSADTAHLSSGSYSLKATYSGDSNYGPSSSCQAFSVATGTLTWDGGGADTKWSTAANWVEDAAPANGDSVVLNTNGNDPTNYDLGGGISLAAVTLGNGAADAALTVGGNAIQLSSGASITNNRAGANTTDLSGGLILSGGGASVSQGSGAAALTISGTISGTGALSKSGAGTLALSGTNTYSGGTNIDAGTLAVDADGGLGNTGGNVTLNGGTLGVGAPFTTARAISLSAGGGTVDTNGNSLTISGAISGAGALTKADTGTLTLTGVKTYSGGTTVSAGTLQGDHSSLQGNITNNAAVVFDQSVLGGTYSGVISGSGSLTKTGTESLHLTGANTYSGGTTVSGGPLSGSTASIQGHIVNNGEVAFAQLTAGTYSGNMSGVGAVSVTGAGKVTFSGTNTYSSETTIAGTLAIGASSAIGSGQINFSSGTLETTGSMTLTNDVEAGGTGATFNTAGNDVTLSGVVDGGKLIKTGGGTLTLGSANTYASTTTISGGTLAIAAANRLGAGTGTLAFTNGATLKTTGAMTLPDASLGSGGGTIDTAGNNVAGGTMSGAGSLTKTGAGTLSLPNVSTYSGGTTVSGGNLQGDTSSLQGNIVNNAEVTFDQGVTGTYAGVMSGSGSLTKSGGLGLILTGANTYSGGTTVSAGALFGNTTSLQGNIVNNADVTFNQTSDGTYSGVISGSGTVTKNSAGKLTFTGVNTYGGTTFASGGPLAIGASNRLGPGMIVISGTGKLETTASFTLTQAVHGSGSAPTVDTAGNDVTISGTVSGQNLTKAGAGTLTLSSSNTHTGTTSLTGGTLAIGAADRLGTSTLALTNGATLKTTGDMNLPNASFGSGGGVIDTDGHVANAGNLSGAGSFTKAGAGLLVLLGTSTYSGGTTVSGGTLQGDTTNLLGNIVNNASVTFDQATDGTYAGVLSGTGDVAKTGGGKLTLSGVSTFSGTLDVTNGILAVTGSLANADVDLTGGTLGGTGSVGDVALSAGTVLTPGMSVGTLSTGAVSFAGGSTFAAELDGSGADRMEGSGAVGLNGATLDLSLLGGYSHTPGTVYTIVQGSAVTGTFAGLANGATIDAGGHRFRVNYTASGVTLTGLPGELPSCSDATKTVPYETAVSIDLVCTGTIDSRSVVDGPDHGTLGAINQGAGTVSYTPDDGYSGPDSLTFKAMNARGDSNTQTITISVGGPPVPVCTGVSKEVAHNAATTVGLACTGLIGGRSIVDLPAHGALGAIDQGAGTVTYVPNDGYAGPDSFSFKATNAGGDSEKATVSLTVAPAPDPGPATLDQDGDGVPNGTDNCRIANPGQDDTDGGGLGDVCDLDDDADGLLDTIEARLRTSPVDKDSDDDGLGDGREDRNRNGRVNKKETNPRRRDTDRDGIQDGTERGKAKPIAPRKAAGTDTTKFQPDLDPKTKTNPRKRDTDGDGDPDGREDRNRNGRLDRGETNPLK